MTAPATRKRPAPLSIRLSACERKRLEKLAGDQPLSRFIKERIFADSRLSDAEIMDRYEMLARILSALGESDVFSNLDVISQNIKNGNLVLNDELEEQIATTCLLVLEMRNDLIRALGLKPPPILDDQL